MPEKLLELIAQVQDCGADVTDVVKMIWVENQTVVDHLIANGVVIPVRCKDCRWGDPLVGTWDNKVWCGYYKSFCLEDGFCSYGERKTENERRTENVR